MNGYYDQDNEPGTSNSHAKNSNDEDKYTDSGYGGSIRDFEPDALAVDGELELRAGDFRHRSPSMLAQRQAAAQVHQNEYNKNRQLLGRAITAVVRLLKDLQENNRKWPIYYPAVEGSSQDTASASSSSNKGKTKVKDEVAAMEGDLDDDVEDNEIASAVAAAPRLVSPQIKKKFNVFKLDLKMGALSSEELVNQLEKDAVASLLEDKIIRSVKHLKNLQDRIEDTSSKVLITGDLNSGKSTFCNALLRRRLLPADQQPCTNVFCEVKDAEENGGKEEVHAVYLGKQYDRNDLSTYGVFQLKDLDDLVSEVDTYSILKVYVDDNRPIEQSLLRNGVVDISLIDAPGLNLDSYQTTEVFSRQEEIDLVVFVVSAENHFTLSAKEFITTAAHEKSFIFIVVNRFDNIKDKGKCMKRIMDQVADLSPETHKDARDFVHFVSSDNVLSSMPGGGDGDGGGGGDDDGDDDGPNEPQDPDFDRLEASLRNFVLEKRALSKLAPAKTYLMNLLTDIEALADVNVRVCKQERDKYLTDLKQITPKFEAAMKESVKVSEHMDREIEALVDKVYKYTTNSLTQLMKETGGSPVVKYTGILDCYDYGMRTKTAIIQRIQDNVIACEEYARHETGEAVNMLKNLGIMHIGNSFGKDRHFQPNKMYSVKKHNLSRSIKTELSLFDYVDIQLPWSRLWSWGNSDTQETSSSKELSVVSNALTLGSLVGGSQLFYRGDMILRAIGVVNTDTIKSLVLPVTVAASLATAYYLVNEVPNTVPRKLTRKIVSEVNEMGYVHTNADRISKECRMVLRQPARELRAAFQTQIESQARQKEECAKNARDAEEGYEYFTQLERDSTDQRQRVEKCILTVD